MPYHFFRMKFLRILPVLSLLFIPVFALQIPLAAQGRNTPDSRDTAAGKAAENAGYSPEDVYFLGRAVAANIVSRYRPYKQNPELTAYLNKICNTLVLNSPVSAPGMFNGYHVQILNSTEINAFASPGGHIFITRDLINYATSEDMLAAVIAHEIAHIQLEHSIRLITDKEISLMLELDAIAKQSRQKMNRMSPASDRMNSLQESVQTMGSALFTNGYTRQQEFDADIYAQTLLVNAGYQPSALTDLLQVLQQKQKQAREVFYSTHPKPALRISNLQNRNSGRSTDTSASRQSRFRTIKR